MKNIDPTLVKQIGSIIVTVILMTAALFVIMSSRYKDREKKWAYGVIAFLMGYWIHS